MINPVKGTHDIMGKEANGYNDIVYVLSSVATLYGYKEMETPILEHTELFSRGTGSSSDIVRKEMYTFLDKGDRSLTLRPEFTAGIVRSLISNKLYADGNYPLKYFYHGPVFRYERPQTGRYRQFHQFGVEMFGEDSPYADAETIIMALHSLYALGFKNVVLKINSLGDEETRSAYKEALKAYFAKHIDDMCSDCHERLESNPLRILDCKVPSDHELALSAPKIADYMSENSKNRFATLCKILDENEIEYEVDSALVRGLDYYSEVVFEFHYASDKGEALGALGGGGHYGGLVKELGGPELCGVGYAFGIERLYSLLTELGIMNHEDPSIDVYIVPIGENCLQKAMTIALEVRSLGYLTEMPLSNKKVSAAFKAASKKGASVALTLGEEELANGQLKMKDMETGEEKVIDIVNIEHELDEHFGAHECCEGEECHCHEGHCSCHEE